MSERFSPSALPRVHRIYPSASFCPPSPPILGGVRILSEFKVPQNWGIVPLSLPKCRGRDQVNGKTKDLCVHRSPRAA
ncbi:MAG: hypothetical protein GC158_17160 [Cyanobacteria bacterium RI_101]|nr:hypothetical protein [Cyanobacteria bacterium RI_101]